MTTGWTRLYRDRKPPEQRSRAAGRVARRSACAGLAALIVLAGCATPIGVHRVEPRDVYRTLTASALTNEVPSAGTSQVLLRLDLAAAWEERPEAVLAELHAGLGGLEDTDRLFALAELSFLLADANADPARYLASAVYAYAFLFPGDPSDGPKPTDPRLRLALDLYNRGLASGLVDRHGDAELLDLSARTLELPFGDLEIGVDPGGFSWAGRPLEQFVSVADYAIRGMRNRYREPGIGAPLMAKARPSDAEVTEGREKWMSTKRGLVPVTAVLRFDDVHRALRARRVVGHLALHSMGDSLVVPVEGRDVPLEFEPSVSLAYALDGAPVWDTEIAGFRSTDLPILRRQGVYGLAMLLPYRPGRVPVVMVHGTASSPARWAELANELLGDPEIAARCQLWYFTYNTGQPIAISASKLREDLRNAVAALDPSGADEALRHMVVIGHSQGGLLTKLTAVSSGDAFWKQLSDEPFDRLEMEPATRDLIQSALFVEPLPFVERLIFIATPHRGSFLSMGILGQIGSWLVQSPANLTKSIGDVIRRNPDLKANQKLKDFKVPTAVDNMRADNPFLRTLVSLPIAPGVTAHSIIPVATSGPIAEGDDGVVEYKSAHLDGVASELVVRSGHSTQAEPATIEEVRRILHEHLRSVGGSR